MKSFDLCLCPQVFFFQSLLTQAFRSKVMLCLDYPCLIPKQNILNMDRGGHHLVLPNRDLCQFIFSTDFTDLHSRILEKVSAQMED